MPKAKPNKKTQVKVHCKECSSLSVIVNGQTLKYIPCICPKKNIDVVVTPKGVIVKTRKDIQIDFRNFNNTKGGEI